MNRKKSYKDMKRFRNTCRKQKRRYYGKTAFLYEKRAWTKAEDNMVLEHKIPDVVLSAKTHRSVGAIQKRRCKLKKMKNDTVFSGIF